MSTEADSSFEKVGMALDFLRSLQKRRLGIIGIKGFQRVRDKTLVCKYQKELIFFQNVDLGDRADIQYTLGPSIYFLRFAI